MLKLKSLPTVVLVITGCTLFSCSNEPLDPDVNEGFLNTAFDGQWTWHENGRATYHLTIENGTLTSLVPAMINARRINYAATNCDTDRRHGLIALAWHSDSTDDQGISWRTSTTFRFDLPDASAARCLAGLQEGRLNGVRMVSQVDHDDIYPSPTTEQVEGELIRQDP